jgi:pimeloyl-ACP methyl ester carboxylesterase
MATAAAVMTKLPRPAWLPEAAFPFEIGAVDVDRSPVAVSEVGRGPTLLFYTGIGLFIWRDVILRLSSDFHCVAVDPPGIGLSGPIPRSHATLQRSARAVATVIEALDLRKLTLVVHDSGGPPGFAAAGRVSAQIVGLVAVNTFGWKPAGGAFRTMLSVMGNAATRRFSLSTGVLARVTASPFGAGRRLDDASRRAYRAGFQQSMAAFHDYLRDARDSELYDEIVSALSQSLAGRPLLTIFGERNDPLHFQPHWKALFPNARQVVIPKGNHFPMCDDPDAVAAQIRAWHHDVVAPVEERRS